MSGRGSVTAAAGTGSLWPCRNPPGHSAGSRRWDAPRPCSSSTPAWFYRVQWDTIRKAACDSFSPEREWLLGLSYLKMTSLDWDSQTAGVFLLLLDLLPRPRSYLGRVCVHRWWSQSARFQRTRHQIWWWRSRSWWLQAPSIWWGIWLLVRRETSSCACQCSVNSAILSSVTSIGPSSFGRLLGRTSACYLLWLCTRCLQWYEPGQSLQFCKPEPCWPGCWRLSGLCGCSSSARCRPCPLQSAPTQSQSSKNVKTAWI